MKKIVIYLLIAIVLLFQGCQTKEQLNANEESENNQVSIEEKITKYDALNKSYDENQDITTCLKNDEVFNSEDGSNNKIDKYIEVKFANDLITDYLAGENFIYESLFSIVDHTIQYSSTEEDKSRLDYDIKSLKSQMNVKTESPIYFKLKTVSYLGEIGGIKDSTMLNLKGLISKDNKNFQSLSSFDVLIVKKDRKLYGHIK